MSSRITTGIRIKPLMKDGTLEDHFGSGSTLQRNERVRLAASFWNNVEARTGRAGLVRAGVGWV
jgi:hypothetical protein